jgi:hypothetical protein
MRNADLKTVENMLQRRRFMEYQITDNGHLFKKQRLAQDNCFKWKVEYALRLLG